MSWRIFTHHTLKTLLRAAQVFFLVVVPGVLLWLHFAGLPRAFHPSLVDAAARAGPHGFRYTRSIPGSSAGGSARS